MAEFAIRPAHATDASAMARLFAAVAAERNGIATEPPVDVEDRAEQFALSAASSLVAEARGSVVGMINVDVGRFGAGDIGMFVDASWRGRGIGSALVDAAIEWSREQGLHKLCLEVFPTNLSAIALYRRCGFVEEGRRSKQYRRASGELWDSLVMGLLLE
jgi:RimJ/RimL family protein N-acetyltransferase